jgi:hypothetical protein
MERGNGGREGCESFEINERVSRNMFEMLRKSKDSPDTAGTIT